MLKLTGDQIAKLSDRQLRELVYRLCTAELRRLSLPESAVTAGGDQNAADGGVDVRVELESPPPAQLDFIRAAATAFQVKAQDMSPADIAKEMKPGGVLRPSICSLAAGAGAYVIVSSKGSVADAALRRRLEAMRRAASGDPNAAQLVLDFYDRTRLATWVRRYAGIEMWVRECIGERLKGWQGYGPWSGPSAGSAYLHDALGRVISRTSENTDPMSADQGIDAIRGRLRKAGGVVRLVGLSGTGKTRLVQALFEEGIGSSARLDDAQVLYTDLGHAPEPSARNMVLRVAADQQRAIVVVDNCNPATHRALADAVASAEGHVSLISIEYDVADDEPEATDVFELAPASHAVLDALLAQRAPHVSQTDRGLIADFAGGNARIALALARTVQHGETLGVLTDSELFRRLFNQNQRDNEALLCAAEACSLVYSFEGEDLESADSELQTLARLANCTSRELFRHVSTLVQRDLVQRRSRWRAVLPHALANRLAKSALRNIPRIDLFNSFGASQRLLRSFSRRLGYLHDCPEAIAIAERWIDDEKWLVNPRSLSELGQAMFFNLAPLVPTKVLEVLERAIGSESGRDFLSAQQYSTGRWLTLSRALAYEVHHFERAALLVLQFAEAEEGRMTTARNAWTELFQLDYSGALAPPKQRANFLRALLRDNSPTRHELAAEAVAAMIKCSHFGSSREFSFGARSRGFGWEPDSLDEYLAWFNEAFVLAQELVERGGSLRRTILTAVAQELRQLWDDERLRPQLDAFARRLASHGGWPEGWVAARGTLRFDGPAMAAQPRAQLEELESLLRPMTLEQQIRSYVIELRHGGLDVADSEDSDDATEDANPLSAWERVYQRATSLGEQASGDDELLLSVVDELLSGPDARQLAFGVGLGRATRKPLEQWKLLRDTYSRLGDNERNVSLLVGFLRGLRTEQPAVASRLLDELITDPLLCEFFPTLQGGAWDAVSGDRLLRALEHGRAPAARYLISVAHEACEGLDLDTYRAVVQRLVETPDGVIAGLDLLGMELHRFKARKQEVPEQLVLLGREILSGISFDMPGRNLGYRLKEIAKMSLRGEAARPTAKALLERFAVALEDYRTSADSYGELAGVLFRLQPDLTLSALLGRARRRLFPIRMRFENKGVSVIECASHESILAWVEVDPATRLPQVAAEIEILDREGKGQPGLSPLAAKLLSMAKDKGPVLQAFAQRFHPSGWSGSLAQALGPYLKLAASLAASSDPDVSKWAVGQIEAMNARIAADQRAERNSQERFE